MDAIWMPWVVQSVRLHMKAGYENELIIGEILFCRSIPGVLLSFGFSSFFFPPLPSKSHDDSGLPFGIFLLWKVIFFMEPLALLRYWCRNSMPCPSTSCQDKCDKGNTEWDYFKANSIWNQRTSLSLLYQVKLLLPASKYMKDGIQSHSWLTGNIWCSIFSFSSAIGCI